jgi:hypothetical protein
LAADTSCLQGAPVGNDNDSPDPTAAAPAPEARRRREPPTIELAASDVTSETAANGSAADAGATQDPGSAPQASAETASGGPEARSPRSGLFAAAATGAGGALAVLAAAWFAGWPPAEPAAPHPVATDSSVTNALASRLTTLEADFRTAAALPQASGTDTAALVRRIDALEHAQNGLREALAAEKSGAAQLAAGLDALKSEIAALTAAPRETAATPDLSALETRLAEIDATARRAASAASRPAGDETALRRAVTATQLDAAVRQGAPYAALLAAAKSFESGPAALAPLEPFATAGLPSAKALGDELLAALPQLAPPPERPGGGLLDRLQASATRLIRIRRDGPAEGDSRPAIVARAAAAATYGDPDAAPRELIPLPAGERAPVAAWLGKVAARHAALAAARSYAATASAALAQPAR